MRRVNEGRPRWPGRGNRLRSLNHSLESRLTLVSISLPPIHASIPPIFDSVIAAIPQSPCNLRPTTSHVSHHLLDHLSLLMSDRIVIQGLFQVLMVALSTLLGCSMLHMLRYANPIIRALLLDQIEEVLILVCVPWSTMSRSASHSRYKELINWVLCASDSNKPPRTIERRRWWTPARRVRS
jgi:hypothetical protein